MRIFLVDDEKEIADLIELYLRNDGFDVIKCSDGKTALEKILISNFALPSPFTYLLSQNYS